MGKNPFESDRIEPRTLGESVAHEFSVSVKSSVGCLSGNQDYLLRFCLVVDGRLRARSRVSAAAP